MDREDCKGHHSWTIFCGTGGAHLTSNHMLATLEAKQNNEEIKQLEQSKKECQYLKNVHSNLMKS